jgi:hypothetical protein
VAVVARRLAGDPLAAAVVQRGLAVQAGRDLHAHPRPAALHAREKAEIHFARLVFQHAHGAGDAGRFELRDALPGDQRIRIEDGGDHAPDSGAHQRVGARWRPAEMTARFQRDVGGGAADVVTAPLRVGHRLDLGVRLARRLRVAGADDHAVADEHAADPRVRRGDIHALRGPGERQRHGLFVRPYRPFGRGRRARLEEFHVVCLCGRVSMRGPVADRRCAPCREN